MFFKSHRSGNVYFLSNCSRSSKLMFEAKYSISMFIDLHTWRHDAKDFMSKSLRIFRPIWESPGFSKKISIIHFQVRICSKRKASKRVCLDFGTLFFSVVSLTLQVFDQNFQNMNSIPKQNHVDFPVMSLQYFEALNVSCQLFVTLLHHFNPEMYYLKKKILVLEHPDKMYHFKTDIKI